MISRDKLPEHPVSALSQMADRGWIPRPVYVGEPLQPGSPAYAIVVEVEGYGHRVVVGDTKPDAKRKAAEELLGHILATTCPNPTKVRFATQELAQGRVGVHQAIGHRGIQQAYLCRCGWWHLSSRAAA